MIAPSFWLPQNNLSRDYFYKNTDADELIFIHKGSGKLRTHLGNLDFKYGDYLLVPRGIIYKIDFDTEDNRLFIVESHRPIYTPKRIETGLVNYWNMRHIVNVIFADHKNWKLIMKQVIF